MFLDSLSQVGLFTARIALATCAAGGLVAQGPVTTIIGNVWDGNGGPFTTGNVYHIMSTGGTCCGVVPAGQTLTIQPGAIVKIDASLIVNGTLVANGACFTSWLDDSRGGDSNADGSSTMPSAGDWGQIDFTPGSTGTIEDCEIFYGGNASPAASVFVQGGTVALRRNWIRFSNGDGLHCGNNRVTVDDNDIDDCANRAVFGAVFQGLPLFTNNRASNNAQGDFIYCTTANETVGGLLDIQKTNTLNDSGLVVIGPEFTSAPDLIVRPGDTLRLQPGTVIKFRRGRFFVNGRLEALGTPTERVSVTLLTDDTIAGDSNKDGNATTPRRGDLNTFEINTVSMMPPASAQLSYFDVRYTASGGGMRVRGTATSVQADHCEIAFSNGPGVLLQGAMLALTDSVIRDNDGIAMDDMNWPSILASRDNIAMDNGSDHIAVFDSVIDSIVPVTVRNLTSGVVVMKASLTIQAGGIFSLPPGAIFKPFTGRGVTVNAGGRCDLVGSGYEPIVFTSLRDDVFGGDTNLDGSATSPSPGQVGTINFLPGSMGRVEHVLINYGGNPGLRLNSGSIQCRSSLVQRCSGDGFQLNDFAGLLEQPVAFDNGDAGIHFTGTNGAVRHGTTAGNTGPGFESDPGHIGQIVNSISWSNGGGNYAGYVAGDVFRSNGGFAGVNGNLNVNPQFESLANGVLTLFETSPLIDQADPGLTFPLAFDHREASRTTDAGPAGTYLPDMGAYEHTPFRLIALGEPRTGETVTFQFLAPNTAVGAMYVGLLDGVTTIPGIGNLLVGSVAIASVAAPPIPAAGMLQFPIPDLPRLRGIRIGFQWLGVDPIPTPFTVGFSDMYRTVLR